MAPPSARLYLNLAGVAGGAYWYVICQSASDLIGAGSDLFNMSQMLR
jgi:hypothetical protein